VDVAQRKYWRQGGSTFLLQLARRVVPLTTRWDSHFFKGTGLQVGLVLLPGSVVTIWQVNDYKANPISVVFLCGQPAIQPAM